MTTEAHKRKFSLQHIFLALLFLGFLRSVLDWWLMFNWLNEPIMHFVFLFDTVYIFTLFTGFSFLIVFLSRFMLKEKPSAVAVQNLYYDSAFIWLCYPLVPLVTFLYGDNYSKTIEFFEYLPFFMIEKNYLPSGMIFIMPILVGGYTYLVKKHLKISLIQAILLSTVSQTIIYLLFYQYLYGMGLKLRDAFNSLIFLGSYTLVMCMFDYVFFKESKPYLQGINHYLSRILLAKVMVSLIALIIGIYIL